MMMIKTTTTTAAAALVSMIESWFGRRLWVLTNVESG